MPGLTGFQKKSGHGIMTRDAIRAYNDQFVGMYYHCSQGHPKSSNYDPCEVHYFHLVELSVKKWKKAEAQLVSGQVFSQALIPVFKGK